MRLSESEADNLPMTYSETKQQGIHLKVCSGRGIGFRDFEHQGHTPKVQGLPRFAKGSLLSSEDVSMLSVKGLSKFKPKSQGKKGTTVWVDMDNSPHVPFFVPIIEELEQLGYSILLTARDCFQVRDLVTLFNLPCSFVGRHYGKHILAKVAGTFLRASHLAYLIHDKKIGLAVAHGSRAQVIAANLLGVPSCSLGDYEFAKGIVGFKPDWMMVPAVIPDSAIQFDTARVVKYPGIKEDVYIPRFTPDPYLRARLGLGEDDLVVTGRPPADEAHYFNPASDKLFRAAINFVTMELGAKVVLLPRNERQGAFAKTLWPELFAERKIIIPDCVVNGLSLIWISDAVISGGGTMNREAAALGVPVYSAFRGNVGAVDRYLEQNGRLVLLENITAIRERLVITKNWRRRALPNIQSRALRTIVDNIVAIVETGRPGQKAAA